MAKRERPSLTAFADDAPRRAAADRRAAREAASLRRENEELTRRLETLRAPRPLALPPVPRRRRGRDDFVRVIWPDTHGMLAHRAALAAAVADLRALDPDEWVHLGDFLEAGGFLAQHHVLGYVAQSAYTFDEDVLAGNRILDEVQRAAPRARLHYIEGNHEQRIERWCVQQALANGRDAERLRRQNGTEAVLDLARRGIRYIRMAECYDGLPLQGCIRLGKCLFIHQPPRGTGDARQVARRFGHCVVYGHTHTATASVVRTVAAGEIGAFNPGCLCEVQPLYAHTNPTDWTHGFAVQLVAKSGTFLHINVPIVGGVSLLQPLLKERVT